MTNSGKLGQIIRLKKNYSKNLTFVSLFGAQIGWNQVSLFILYAKRIPFLELNTVEYCQIVLIKGHFESFLVIF